MRGKVQLLPVHHDKVGITPACAGKRLRCTSVQTFRWDHPRMCGEKITLHIRANVSLGSPPHVRGKADTMRAVHRMQRITPAHAGKRELRSASGSACRDHPRVCGEKALSTFSSLKNSGSPPRMRGKADAAAGGPRVGRITPACAGKSKPHPWWRRPEWDHPRMCGEKSSVFRTAALSTGSPPHMRGKGFKVSFGGNIARITPAHAGKSLRLPGRQGDHRDHPRTCGEKPRRKRNYRAGVGSPPHMRGKVYLSDIFFTSVRITPAHAGKSAQ